MCTNNKKGVLNRLHRKQFSRGALYVPVTSSTLTDITRVSKDDVNANATAENTNQSIGKTRYLTLNFLSYLFSVLNAFYYISYMHIIWLTSTLNKTLGGVICRSCRYYKKRKLKQWSSQLHHHQQNEKSLHTPLNSKRTRHMILESQVMFWDRYTHVENPILSFLKTVLQWLITSEVESLQGSTLTVARLPGASEMRLRASENGTQLARKGMWKLFCDMFNSWRAKWLILNSVLEVVANFT